MKTLLVLSVLLIGAHDASATTPNQVCERIAQINANNASACAQLISRNRLDEGVLNVAYRVANSSTSIALDVLRAGANRYVDLNASTTCEKVTSINVNNVVSCINAIADKEIAPELVVIASKLANSSTSIAVSALNAGANTRLDPSLSSICEEMVGINVNNVTSCIQVIANKTVRNGSEQICRTALRSSSSTAIECLRGIVIPITGHPGGPTDPGNYDVRVSIRELQDLTRELKKTRAMLERGLIEPAQRNLDESIRRVERLAH